jgi:23S rRNA pseudouridine1911/1915/1917 synthase
MNRPPFPILFEDNHLLIVNKPALLPTMGVAAGKPNLLEQAKLYIKHKYEKPGKVYLGLVSRLDAPVTGILAIARTSKAASRLTDAFRAGEVEKTYWAVVDGSPPAEGHCTDLMRKDERRRKMHVTKLTGDGVQEARLRFSTIRTVAKQRPLLAVVLETGRKHQIRVQLSSRGWPIVGDRKYGSTAEFSAGIALHSHSLQFEHPVKRTPVSFTCPPPESWKALGI